MPKTHEPGGRARKTSGSIHTAPGTFKPTLKRRNRIAEQFAPRTISMLKSPAFCALSLSARRVLDRLEIELASHGGRDNGQLPLTYAQLEAYGLHKDAIAPAIRECVALGFVEITQLGRASSTAEYRHPSKYRLTYRPTEDGVQSDEWRRIKNEEEAEMKARTARLSPPQKTKRHPRKPGATLPPETMGKGGPNPTPGNHGYKATPETMGTSIFSGGTVPAITRDASRHSREAIMGLVAGVVAEQLGKRRVKAVPKERGWLGVADR
jgi:hypothetical protein